LNTTGYRLHRAVSEEKTCCNCQSDECFEKNEGFDNTSGMTLALHLAETHKVGLITKRDLLEGSSSYAKSQVQTVALDKPRLSTTRTVISSCFMTR